MASGDSLKKPHCRRCPCRPCSISPTVTTRWLQRVKHAAKQLVREAVGRYIGLYPYQRRPFLDQNTVLIVDQAQQISTPDMARLLQHVERSGSKLLLAGDPDALQAVDRGAPFVSFVQRFPAAKLTEPVRPEHPQGREQRAAHTCRKVRRRSSRTSPRAVACTSPSPAMRPSKS